MNRLLINLELARDFLKTFMIMTILTNKSLEQVTGTTMVAMTAYFNICQKLFYVFILTAFTTRREQAEKFSTIAQFYCNLQKCAKKNSIQKSSTLLSTYIIIHLFYKRTDKTYALVLLQLDLLLLYTMNIKRCGGGVSFCFRKIHYNNYSHSNRNVCVVEKQ